MQDLRPQPGILSDDRTVIDTLVVIPFHNRADLALQSLRKLLEGGFPLQQILVIDNGSIQKETEELANEFPDLEIKRQENLGFGAAANHGIRRAIERGYDFTFVLNSDAIVTTEIVQGLVDYLCREENARVAACAPVTVSRGTVDFAGGLIDRRNWSALHVDNPDEVSMRLGEPGLEFYLTGCALMCRNSAVQEAGMFDESFFMYWEDCDLCLRLAAAGWKLVVLPELAVEHLVGGSSDDDADGFRIYYYTRNRFLMWWRHGGGLSTLKRIVTELLPILTAPSPRLTSFRQLTLGQAVFHGLLKIGGKRQLLDASKPHPIGSYTLWLMCTFATAFQGAISHLKFRFGLTRSGSR